MKTKQKRSRPAGRPGFALISVLALVSVLVILLGALMGTNRTAFSLLKVSQAKDRIDRTLSSVYAYCRFRLEHECMWAKSDFTGRGPLVWGHLRISEIRGSGGAIQTVVGYDMANNTSFAVDVCNNLKDKGEVAVIGEARDAERQLDGVPLGFCRLDVKVEGDGHLEGAEIMVRNPGLVGGVCLASDCLLVDAREFDLVTKDPIKNQARSLGETKLIGMDNFISGVSRSTYPATDISTDNPVVWSGTANLFSRDGVDFQTREPFKESHPSLPFQDQRFMDESQTLFDVPNVGLDDLEQVKPVAGDGNKPIRELEPGLYRFEQVGDPMVRVFTRRDVPASGNLEDTSGPVREFWWMEEEEGPVSRPDGQIAGLVNAAAGVVEHKHVYTDANKYVTINSTGGAKVDLRNRRMVFDTRYNFEVDGDFSLIGSSVNGDDTERQVNPAVHFADPELVAQAEEYDVGDAANLAAEDTEKGSLRASGAINIQGDINGSTTLAAKGDVTLALGRFFDPDGNSDVNFSVFSEGSVSIKPPPIKEDVNNRDVNVYFDEEGEETVVVEENGGVNCAEQNLRFTGLIYAAENVDIDLQDTVNEPDQRRNLFVEGSIVAKNGHLRFFNANHLELIYNPQFVDRLLPSLLREGQRRIEVTGWRTTKPSAFSAEVAD